MNPNRGKILVIRGGAIGDFVLTLPAVTALRKHFPSAHIEVLGYPHIVQLAVAGGLVDRARSIEARPLAGFFARNGELDDDWACYLSEFDLIVSYLYDPDEIFVDNVKRCSRAQFIIGPHRPRESEKLHAARVYLRPLERLAIFDGDPVPRLSFASRASTRRSLALHPGSGSERKNWPEESWAELILKLVRSTSFDLLLVGGEAEGERLTRLSQQSGVPAPRIRVARSLPLADLARLLTGSAGFIGHDSGISHLAAAVGLPGILLWGETTEEIWRPPSQKVSLLRHPEGLSRLPVDKVFEATREMLNRAA